MNPQHLITTRHDGAEGALAVMLITLNRPKQLNALNDEVMDELGQAMTEADADPGIGCIVITGSEKAFAAGADIGAMATYSYMDVYLGNYITRNWEQMRRVRKPVIAAATICGMGLPAVMMAKQCVNRAFESGLDDGVSYERQLFHSLFATEDQKEGMAAFVAKRKAAFKHR